MNISYALTDNYSPDEKCGICRDPFNPLTDRVFTHDDEQVFYHGRCIVNWMKVHPLCPVCRRAVDQTSLTGEKELVQREVEAIQHAKRRYWIISNGFLVIGFGSLALPILNESFRDDRQIAPTIGLIALAAVIYIRRQILGVED